MNISALVVVFNEDRHLRDCLASLKPFEEVVVADIGSADHSIAIAHSMGAKVIRHPWVPIGEMVLPGLFPSLQNDWVIRVDPDEILPPSLVEDLIRLEVSDNIGIVHVPYQYYFLNRRLDTTLWGGVRPIPRVMHRDRVTVTADVHRALRCKPGCETYTLPSRPGNAVIHYWVDDYRQLIEKHERYLKMEGESRYNNGFRFDWKSLLYNPLKSFAASFIKYAGWRGGWAGWFLSVFIAVYEARAWLSLMRYEKALANRHSGGLSHP
ncbi:MAG: glycosyltransferase family 2 protein [Chloroflexi bacterium]|nr:glycosyltransferase family 2 protein [Chloroflexota bacterium]